MAAEENAFTDLAARWAALEGQDLFASETDVDLGSDDDDWATGTESTAPLASATEATGGRPVQASAPEVLPVWELLSVPQEEAQLAQLRHFVMWLVDRHELQGKIRPCWSEHGPAIEALTALWQRYLEVYLRPSWGGDAEGHLDVQSNRGYEALVWLDQLSVRAERLARGTFTRCPVEHLDEDWAIAPLDLGKLARTAALPVSG